MVRIWTGTLVQIRAFCRPRYTKPVPTIWPASLMPSPAERDWASLFEEQFLEMKSAGAETFRTFIAIEIPSDLRLTIVEYISRLRRDFPDVKASWGREDNLHLTLKFLGNIPADRIAVISSAAEAVAQTCGPFKIDVGGCGAFPRPAKPNVLWVGIEDPEHKLQALHHVLEDRCHAAGFELDASAFHPHLTIARLRDPARSRSLAQAHQDRGFPVRSFCVSEIVVFKSEMLREGSRHTPLSHHRLSPK